MNCKTKGLRALLSAPKIPSALSSNCSWDEAGLCKQLVAAPFG
jgi:hypothetical protein